MAEKEQKGDLYKKDLYIMKEDLEKIKSKSKLKVMHDNILKKLINEDYRDFIFKTEEKEAKSSDNKELNKSLNENSNNNSKNNNQKEDNGEKEINEEIDYLKELYRLNYLTFSPMATEYFDKISNLSNSSSNKNPKINIPNINESNNFNIFNEIEKKTSVNKEEKLLKILNFDYNCFEINNDLLFNICQGFIDTEKLKESNIKIPQQEPQKESLNNSSDSSNNDEYDIYEYDEELEQDMVNKINDYVTKYENNIVFKGGIIRFKDELNSLPPKCKNKIKNLFYRKWEKEFIKLEQNNEKIMKKIKDDEKRKELKKQRKYLNKLKEGKIKKIEEGNDGKENDEFKNIQKEQPTTSSRSGGKK